MRAFFAFNVFSYLPLAVVHTIVSKGGTDKVKIYMWFEKYWAHVAGWITSLANLTMAISFIATDFNNSR